MKQTVLFCTGCSGSGKSFFINNYLPTGLFYNLKSATTRKIRPGEQDGKNYYFQDEDYFSNNSFVTYLWVNEFVWEPGQPKWLYGVPEFEVLNNLGKNFVYDVIEPKYARQMIDWFKSKNLHKSYNFRTIYFLPLDNNWSIVQSRKNMPNDVRVRENNTCLPKDFLNAGLQINFLTKCSAQETIIPIQLKRFIRNVACNNR